MKRIVLALALGVSFAAVSQADWGGPAPVIPAPIPGGMQAAQSTVPHPAPQGTNKYGRSSTLNRLMWWKKDAGCNGCGAPDAGMSGANTPGTLVFPTHPYARSPRDWFMFGY
jgi:hypothetical protein